MTLLVLQAFLLSFNLINIFIIGFYPNLLLFFFLLGWLPIFIQCHKKAIKWIKYFVVATKIMISCLKNDWKE